MSTLRALADNLWEIHHAEFVVGGLRIGTRTTVLRLDDGSVLLHGPGPLDAAHVASIRAIGPVGYLLAPNLEHHLFLPAAKDAFPDAAVLGVAGLAARHPTLRVDHVLDGGLPPALAGQLAVRRLDGAPKLDEHVLYHAASRTLIGADLVFNLHGMTGVTRFAMWINGANDRMCVTRLARSAFLSDARAAAASVPAMADAWDIGRVIVAHGDVFEGDGNAALREAWAFAG
jgi:hypothetical protein